MSKKSVVATARVLLALVLLVFGLNGFLHFMSMPSMAEPATQFIGAMLATGYVLQLVWLVQIIVGLLLLANRYVPFALLLLAPISVNIIAFHLFLDPGGIAPGALVFLLNVGLALHYRDHYHSVLS